MYNEAISCVAKNSNCGCFSVSVSRHLSICGDANVISQATTDIMQVSNYASQQLLALISRPYYESKLFFLSVRSRAQSSVDRLIGLSIRRQSRSGLQIANENRSI